MLTLDNEIRILGETQRMASGRRLSRAAGRLWYNLQHSFPRRHVHP
jgi:hypothetical protein